MVKKLKVRLVEGAIEVEEEEHGKGPLALTQGMGEDAEEVEYVKEKYEEKAPKAKDKETKTQKPPTA